jgi:glycerol-3-phosphate dehydrogenase subunit C
MLQAIPGTQVTVVERCSGHDGTWGIKSEYFANSMKIGRPVFRQMAALDPDYISSDCAIAARQIEQAMARQRCKKTAPADTYANCVWARLNPSGESIIFLKELIMGHITADSLMTLETYANVRHEVRARGSRIKRTERFTWAST